MVNNGRKPEKKKETIVVPTYAFIQAVSFSFRQTLTVYPIGQNKKNVIQIYVAGSIVKEL